ncbi:MAG: hypothetical protein K9L56_13245 [Clostridiales bacterium]|nr:hypothetical protein [Clostridiales bacterium]
MDLKYTKVNFVDRDDTKPDSYIVDGQVKTILKDDSGLITDGTDLNQAELSKLDEGLDNVINKAIVDETQDKKYAMQLKVIDGKPVLEYEEVL